MKTLSREEMKKVMGGTFPVSGQCTTDTCCSTGACVETCPNGERADGRCGGITTCTCAYAC